MHQLSVIVGQHAYKMYIRTVCMPRTQLTDLQNKQEKSRLLNPFLFF